MTISINSLLAVIQTASTAELLAFYNAHRAPIKKFRDRATAEKRCAELLTTLKAAASSQSNAAPAAVAATTADPAPAPVTTAKMKTYFGIVRDHSGSMSHISRHAQKDYNNTLAATQQAARNFGIETVASIVRCGGGFQREVTHRDVQELQPLTHYGCPGHDTPLFSSVRDLIDLFKTVPDFNDPEVTFVIMATTDGQNNAGISGETLASQMKTLMNTDRWTFVFRVPKGDKRDLVRLGIPEGNILEWDQTERGVAQASAANEAAVAEFYSARSTGVRSSKTFYSSMKDVKPADVKAVLTDISSEVQLFPVNDREEGQQIRDFVEARLKGGKMAKGAAFYQLVKTEDKIQDYKLIAIRDKTTNAVYCGPAARDMLGLPHYGDARVRPGDHGNFDVFVQSTSVNRKVNANTQLLYWAGVGVAFKEGKSAV